MTDVRSLLDPPIAFAHRGASAYAPPNTLEAFHLGLRLGATGLESDVWLTADGVAVLDHDGVVRHGLRRRPIASLPRAALPQHIPELADLYAQCGTRFELSLDVKDPAAAEPTLAVARAAGEDAIERMWLCHPDIERLVAWREGDAEVRLVNSTRLRRIREGPERRASRLAASSIDAVNLHHSDWSAGLTTLFHRFGRVAFGWDAQHERVLRSLVRMGIDGVYSNWVDRMVEVVVPKTT